MQKPLLLLTILVLILPQTSSTADIQFISEAISEPISKPRAFEAIYKVQYSSIDLGNATMSLESLPNERFKISIKAKASGWVANLLSDVLSEESIIEQLPDGTLRSLNYTYTQYTHTQYTRGNKKRIKKNYLFTIDYPNQIATNKKGTIYPFETEHLHDRLSFAFMLSNRNRINAVIPKQMGISDGNKILYTTITPLSKNKLENKSEKKLGHEAGSLHYQLTHKNTEMQVKLDKQNDFIPSYIEYVSDDHWAVSYTLQSITWK